MSRFAALEPGLFVILAITACSFGLAQIGIVQHYGLGPLTLAILFGALLGFLIGLINVVILSLG